MPAEHRGKQTFLHFGAVGSDAWVWLNGEPLGEHHNWQEPVSFEVTGKLKAEGANELVVRVSTESGLAGIYKPIAVVAK